MKFQDWAPSSLNKHYEIGGVTFFLLCSHLLHLNGPLYQQQSVNLSDTVIHVVEATQLRVSSSLYEGNTPGTLLIAPGYSLSIKTSGTVNRASRGFQPWAEVLLCLCTEHVFYMWPPVPGSVLTALCTGIHPGLLVSVPYPLLTRWGCFTGVWAPPGQVFVPALFTVALPEPRTVLDTWQAHNTHWLDG